MDNILPAVADPDFVYGQLSSSSKEAFLDIASFFHALERSKVADIVGETELEELEGAALVTSEKGKVKMHNTIRAQGIKLSQGNRITDTKSLYNLLKDQEKLKETKGIWLRDDEDDYVGHGLLKEYIKAKNLDLMSRSLRVLYLGERTKINGRCKRAFKQLRFLHISYEDMVSKRLKRLRKSNWLRFLIVCLRKPHRISETESAINEAEFTINIPESFPLRCLEVDVPEYLPLLSLKVNASNSRSRRDMNGALTSSRRQLLLSHGGFTGPLFHINGSLTSLGELQLSRLTWIFQNLSSLKILKLYHCGIKRSQLSPVIFHTNWMRVNIQS